MAHLEKSAGTNAGSPTSLRGSVLGHSSILDAHTEEHTDIGLELYQKSLQYDPDQLARDAIKVRRKLDYIVLPMICMTYMISFLDKQT
jgi:hypothetical protein